MLVTHVGYPNWVSVAYFTQGWDFFFNQEKYIIGVLYTIGKSPSVFDEYSETCLTIVHTFIVPE